MDVITTDYVRSNGQISGKQLILLFTLLALGNAEHYIEILTQTSTDIHFKCAYEGSLDGRVYFDVFLNDKECLHAADGSCADLKDGDCFCEDKMEDNQALFRITTPRCGQKAVVRCEALNAIQAEKVIDISSTVASAKIEVLEPDCLPLNEPVTLTCNIKDLCSTEHVYIEHHHRYHLSGQNVTYTPTENGIRFSAVVTTSAIFHKPGKYHIKCRNRNGDLTKTKIVHVPRKHRIISEKHSTYSSGQPSAKHQHLVILIGLFGILFQIISPVMV